MSAGEWRNAGARARLLVFDATIAIPALAMVVWQSRYTAGFFVLYALMNAYCVYKGRSMIYFVDRFRFSLRDGVIKARPASYWRELEASGRRR